MHLRKLKAAHNTRKGILHLKWGYTFTIFVIYQVGSVANFDVKKIKKRTAEKEIFLLAEIQKLISRNFLASA